MPSCYALHGNNILAGKQPNASFHRLRTKLQIDGGAAGFANVDNKGKVLVWGSDDPNIYVLNSSNGIREQTLQGRAGNAAKGCIVLTRFDQALSWYESGEMRLWNLNSAKCENILTGHTNCIDGCLILGGDTHALSWSADNLRVWCLNGPSAGTSKERTCSQRLLRHGTDAEQPVGAHFKLVSCPGWGLVWWDCRRSVCHHTVPLAAGVLKAYMVFPSGKQVLSWDSKGLHVWRWDTKAAQWVKTLWGDCGYHGTKNKESMRRCVIFDGGTKALSLGRLGVKPSGQTLMRVWDLTRDTAKEDCLSIEPIGKVLQVEDDHVDFLILTGGMKVLYWSADAKSEDKAIKLWDWNTGLCERILSGHSHPVVGCALLNDERAVLSWSRDGNLRRWNLENGRCEQSLVGHSADACRRTGGVSVRLLGGEKLVSWGHGKGSLAFLWNLQSGKCDQALLATNSKTEGYTRLSETQQLLTWHSDGRMYLWPPSCCNPRELTCGSFTGHTSKVGGCVLLDGEDKAISWSDDRFIVWDLQTMTCISSHERPEDADEVIDCVSAASGNVVLLQCQHSWAVWDLKAPPKPQQGTITGAVLTADGRMALTWSNDIRLIRKDESFRLWDLDNSQPQGECLKGHAFGVTGCLLFPCQNDGSQGERAVSWGPDRIIRVWHLTDNGACQMQLHGHMHMVSGCKIIRRDSERTTNQRLQLISWSKDRSLRMWNLESGECEKIMHGHTHEVAGCALNLEQTRAISWSNQSDLEIKSWNLVDCDQELAPICLVGHTDAILGCTWTGAGAISWSLDGTIRAWDESGLELSAYRRAFANSAHLRTLEVIVMPDGGALPDVGIFRDEDLVVVTDISYIGIEPSAWVTWENRDAMDKVDAPWQDWFVESILRCGFPQIMFRADQTDGNRTLVHKLAGCERSGVECLEKLRENCREIQESVSPPPNDCETARACLGLAARWELPSHRLGNDGIQIESTPQTPLQDAMHKNNQPFVQLLLDDYCELSVKRPDIDLPRRQFVTEYELVALLKTLPGMGVPFLKSLALANAALVGAFTHCDFDVDSGQYTRSSSATTLRWEEELDKIWESSSTRTITENIKIRTDDTAWGQLVKAQMVPIVGNVDTPCMPFSELMELALNNAADDPSLFDAPIIQVRIQV